MNVKAARVGLSRFRQRFLRGDASQQIQDDEVNCCETMKMLLVMLVMLEKLLGCPRNPTVTDTDGQAPLHQAAGDNAAA